MPVNGDIRQNTGEPILQGTMIKVQKKYLSSSALQSLADSNPKSSPIVSKEPEKIQDPQGIMEKMQSVFSRLMNNRKTRQLVIFTGATLLSVTVAASVMLILDTPTPPPKKKQAPVPVEAEAEFEYQVPPFEVAAMQKTYARFKDKPNSFPVDTIPGAETAVEKPLPAKKNPEVATGNTTSQSTETESKKTENPKETAALAKNETVPESRAVENLPPSGLVDGQFIFTNRTSGEELKAIVAQMNAMSASKKRK